MAAVRASRGCDNRAADEQAPAPHTSTAIASIVNANHALDVYRSAHDWTARLRFLIALTDSNPSITGLDAVNGLRHRLEVRRPASSACPIQAGSRADSRQFLLQARSLRLPDVGVLDAGEEFGVLRFFMSLAISCIHPSAA